MRLHEFGGTYKKSTVLDLDEVVGFEQREDMGHSKFTLALMRSGHSITIPYIESSKFRAMLEADPA